MNATVVQHEYSQRFRVFGKSAKRNIGLACHVLVGEDKIERNHPAGVGEASTQRAAWDRRKMDGYPVLQIVRCRLGTEMEMDNQGYPFTMAAHSHSHLPHPAHHAHFPRSHYPHPCGMPINPSC